LVVDLVAAQRGWPGASVERIIYCTARVDGRLNPAGHAEQDVYLKALVSMGSIDHIEYGKYVTGVRTRPLAVQGSHGPTGPPRIVSSTWSVMRFAGDLAGRPADGAGHHWWRRLGPTDYTAHQLPDPAAGFTRPVGW
jgi:hypothetical protein